MVLMNLLTNAANAIDREGSITIRTSAQDGMATMAVSDTGRGIAPDDLPRIFDPFFTTRAPGKGTGLGLSVSYEIVKKHGGSIEVNTTPGAGATFAVKLPLAGAGAVGIAHP